MVKHRTKQGSHSWQTNVTIFMQVIDMIAFTIFWVMCGVWALWNVDDDNITSDVHKWALIGCGMIAMFLVIAPYIKVSWPRLAIWYNLDYNMNTQDNWRN